MHFISKGNAAISEKNGICRH